MCQEKLVQEVVDTLLDNEIRGQPMRDDHSKVYKSFSDVIEGKEGTFMGEKRSSDTEFEFKRRDAILHFFLF